MGMRVGMVAVVLALTAATGGMVAAADQQGVPESSAKLVVVPTPSSPGVPADLPASVQELLGQGWRIGQVQSIGNGAQVLLVLEHRPTASTFSFNGGALPGGDGLPNLPFFTPPMGHGHGRGMAGVPGAGIPTHAATPGTTTVYWADHGTTTITITDATIGARARAHVQTTESDGKTVVSYDATAFVDAAGATEVDGRGAPVTGAKDYVPDSFRIHSDGRVEIEDDQGSRSEGRTDHAPAAPAPAPAPEGSGPHGQKEL